MFKLVTVFYFACCMKLKHYQLSIIQLSIIN